MRKEQRHKITLTTGSVFIKHKVDSPSKGRRRYYTPVTINPKDLSRLTIHQQDTVKHGALFPIRDKEFKEILQRLKAKVKFKTKI